MILPITDELRIVSDTHCWAIERYCAFTKDGDMRWEKFKWYPHLSQATAESLEILVRAAKTDTIEANVGEIKRAHTLVAAAIDAYRDKLRQHER